MLGLRDCICILAPRDAVRVLDWPEVCGRVERETSLPPMREYFDPGRVLMDFVRELLAREDLTRISVEKAGFKLELEAYQP